VRKELTQTRKADIFLSMPKRKRLDTGSNVGREHSDTEPILDELLRKMEGIIRFYTVGEREFVANRRHSIFTEVEGLVAHLSNGELNALKDIASGRASQLYANKVIKRDRNWVGRLIVQTFGASHNDPQLQHFRESREGRQYDYLQWIVGCIEREKSKRWAEDS